MDELDCEIIILQNKILELEKIKKEKQKQKEIEEENAKKLPFDHYFDKLNEFINNKYDHINKKYSNYPYIKNMNDGEKNRRFNNILINEGGELLPVLENICNAIHNINKRLNKLENI